MTRLSVRELDVLKLLACGMTNAAIATVLYLSERTVDAHVRSIFVKLDLQPHSSRNRRVLATLAWFRIEADTRHDDELRLA